MAGTEVGSAYVTILPSARGFAGKLQREIAKAFRGINRDIQRELNSLGGFRIDVEAKIKSSRTELQAQVDAAMANVRAKIAPIADLTRFRADLERSLAGKRIKLPVSIEANILSLARDITKIERDARKLAPIFIPAELDLDETSLRTKLQARVNQIARSGAVLKLPVDIDQADLRRQLRYLQRWVLQTFKLHIPVVLNTGQVIRDLLAIQAAANASGRSKGPRNLMNALAGIAGTAVKAAAVVTALGVAVGGIAGVVPTVVALASAIASLSGLVVALPGALLGAVAGFAALKVGLSGLGDALSNLDDVEAFNKALEKLSPNARQFATSIRDVAPAYREMRTAVQDRLFANLKDEIEPLATAVLPALQGILVGLAGSLGTAATYTSRWIRSAEGLSVIHGISNGLQHTYTLLGQTLQPIVEAFLRIGRVGAEQLPTVLRFAADVADRFRDWVVGAEAAGTLEGAFKHAVSTLSDFAMVLGNIGGIIGDVFAAAGSAGTSGFLQNWITLTGELKQFTSSDFGQQAITDLFTSMARIGSALAPLLPTLVGGVAELAKILATLAVAAAPGLQIALSGLAQGINALAPAAGPVGKAIGDILTAAAPLLPVLGQLAGTVLTVLATNLSTLATALTPVISILANGLAGVLKELAPLFLGVSKAVAPFVIALGGALASALVKILPAVVQLVGVFVDALLPELPRLTDAFLKLVPPIAEAASIFGTELAKVLVDMVPLIPPLAVALVDMAVAWLEACQSVAPILPILAKLTPLLAGGIVAGIGLLIVALNTVTVHFEKVSFAIQFLKDRLTNIEDAFAAIGAFFTETVPGWFTGLGEWFSGLGENISGWLSNVGSSITTALSGAMEWITAPFRQGLDNAKTVVSGGLDDIVAFFVRAPFRGIAAMIGFAGMLVGFFVDVFVTARTAVWNGITSVVEFFAQLPGKVIVAIATLGILLGRKISEAWTTGKKAVTDGITAAVGFFQGLPGRASSALSSLGGILSRAFSNAWTQGKNAISTGINQAVQFFRDLPGKITGAVSDLGGKLYRVGSDIISGLVRGIRDGLGDVLGAIGDVAGSVPGWAKKILGIASPSKVMAGIGDNIAQGLSLGMNRNQDLVEKSAEALLRSVRTSVAPELALAGIPSNAFSFDVAAPSQPSAVGDINVYDTSGDPVITAKQTAAQLMWAGWI